MSIFGQHRGWTSLSGIKMQNLRKQRFVGSDDMRFGLGPHVIGTPTSAPEFLERSQPAVTKYLDSEERTLTNKLD